jgi:hypothetical protein
VTEFKEGDVVRSIRRLLEADLSGCHIDGSKPSTLEIGSFLSVVTPMSEFGLFDAITFKGKPDAVYVNLFMSDFELVNEMEAIVLASEEEE